MTTMPESFNMRLEQVRRAVSNASSEVREDIQSFQSIVESEPVIDEMLPKSWEQSWDQSWPQSWPQSSWPRN